MKKRILFISCCLAFTQISISACSPKYVIFYNYDGTILYKVAYKKGMELNYQGATPTKQEDEMYIYTFSGWNHPLYDVDSSQNYYAQYDKELKKFTVTFRDYNGTQLATANVEYGGNAISYAPQGLTRKSDYDYTYDAKIEYTFSGWEGGDFTYVTSNIILTAKYDETKAYLITYLDSDGTYLYEEYIKEGESSSYTINSTKDASGNQVYVFDKWSNSVSDVHSSMTVYASYKLVTAYTVTFLNYDGSTLGTVKVPEGGTAVYNGRTPTRPSSTSNYVQTSYTFSGWDKSLTNVRSSFSTTAQYTTRVVDNSWQQVRDYILNNGSGTGSTRIIKTGTYTTLNWFTDKKQFNIEFNQTEGSYLIGIGFTFDAYDITEGSMMIVSTSTYETLYWSNFIVIVSNHYYSGRYSSNIKQSKYYTTDWLTLMKNYETSAAQSAIDNCSSYLSARGLPYIF